MTISKTEGNSTWDAFLKRWPLENLSQITLEEYTKAGNADCFTYAWIEKITENLGSIWGGSAFKFGIYSRNNQSDKDNSEGRSYSEKYAWYSKYGGTPEEAFKNVLSEIVKVANAARNGDLELIDEVKLGDSYKWKIAFLYQDRNNPSIVPIYKGDYLRIATNSKEKRLSHLQQQIMYNRAGKSILDYYAEVWASVEAKLSTELTPSQAENYFKESEKFKQIKPPTQKIAGFESALGKHVGLALDNKKTTVYLEAGNWINLVKDSLQEIVQYSADKSRSSNLAANAPNLAAGNAIVKTVVPTMAALIELCDAYVSDDQIITEPNITTFTSKAITMHPLNQILYGPPGTGKTYATVDEALRIIDPEFLQEHIQDRTALKTKFDSLVSAGHIRFVTFHQSFSYEDFVEGLRAESLDNGQLSYEVQDGVFKSLCDAAAARVTQEADAPISLAGKRVWKMSLGNTLGDDAYIYEECIENSYALLGYGDLTNFTGCENRDQIFDKFIADNKDVSKDSYAVTAVSTFILKMKIGDIIVVTEGNTKFRAIGEITGNYRCLSREDQGDWYGQCRDVKWLRVYQPSLPYAQLMHNQFSQMTLYELRAGSINMAALAELLHSKVQGSQTSYSELFKVGDTLGTGTGYEVINVSADLLTLGKPKGNILPIAMSIIETLAEYVRNGLINTDDIRKKLVFTKVAETRLDPYLVNGYSNILPSIVDRLLEVSALDTKTRPISKVLIIDEINRGNISRIFGELITLIEPSKRSGASEALEVTLPYSKKPFSVPSNLYLIGTMNTADRSLTGLDIALRRRFTFKEMAPNPALLDGINIDGVNIGAVLRKINERIEVLLDRDHCLGHAYFMPLSNNESIEELQFIFRQQILPLLQEYFFEDWEHIAWVLNCQNKVGIETFVQKSSTELTSLFGSEIANNLQNSDRRWRINEDAFGNIDCYRNILGASV